MPLQAAGTVASSTNEWSVYATQNTGFGSTVPIVGGRVIYTVGIRADVTDNTDTNGLVIVRPLFQEFDNV